MSEETAKLYPIRAYEICKHPDFPKSKLDWEKVTFADGTIQWSIFCGGQSMGWGTGTGILIKPN